MLTLAGGVRPAGEPIHDMVLRLVVDERLNIIEAGAQTLGMPYPGQCDSYGDAYGSLAGLNLANGFRAAVRRRLGGVLGCTHLTELSQVLPTAVIQAFAGEVIDTREDSASGQQPFQIDRCHALRADGEVVRTYYPRWYRTPAAHNAHGDAAEPTVSETYENPTMKIHEYQGKEILRQFGVPVPRGYPAFTVQEAAEAAQKLGGPVWVVKAQIHAGGRGKGGGVKLARSLDEVKTLAGQILGMQLKTHQTGPEGQKVRRLLIEEGADIKQEYYVAALTDRATQKVALMGSSEGGMDIEEVAHDTPEKIIKVFVDPLAGLTDAQARRARRRHRHPGGVGRRRPCDVLKQALHAATWRPTRRWPRSTR